MECVQHKVQSDEEAEDKEATTSDQSASQTKASKNEGGEIKHGKHVMFSYNWSDSMKTAHKVRDELRATNNRYPIWIDVDDMHGNMLQQMAYAVENAYVVLMFLSPKYEKSKNCQFEASYAVELNKRIIPIFTQEGYKPQGMYGLIAAYKLYFNFGEGLFDKNMANLITEIGPPPKTKSSNKSSVNEPTNINKQSTDPDSWSLVPTAVRTSNIEGLLQARNISSKANPLAAWKSNIDLILEITNNSRMRILGFKTGGIPEIKIAKTLFIAMIKRPNVVPQVVRMFAETTPAAVTSIAPGSVIIEVLTYGDYGLKKLLNSFVSGELLKHLKTILSEGVKELVIELTSMGVILDAQEEDFVDIYKEVQQNIKDKHYHLDASGEVKLSTSSILTKRQSLNLPATETFKEHIRFVKEIVSLLSEKPSETDVASTSSEVSRAQHDESSDHEAEAKNLSSKADSLLVKETIMEYIVEMINNRRMRILGFVVIAGGSILAMMTDPNMVPEVVRMFAETTPAAVVTFAPGSVIIEVLTYGDDGLKKLLNSFVSGELLKRLKTILSEGVKELSIELTSIGVILDAQEEDFVDIYKEVQQNIKDKHYYLDASGEVKLSTSSILTKRPTVNLPATETFEEHIRFVEEILSLLSEKPSETDVASTSSEVSRAQHDEPRVHEPEGQSEAGQIYDVPSTFGLILQEKRSETDVASVTTGVSSGFGDMFEEESKASKTDDVPSTSLQLLEGTIPFISDDNGNLNKEEEKFATGNMSSASNPSVGRKSVAELMADVMNKSMMKASIFKIKGFPAFALGGAAAAAVAGLGVVSAVGLMEAVKAKPNTIPELIKAFAPNEESKASKTDDVPSTSRLWAIPFISDENGNLTEEEIESLKQLVLKALRRLFGSNDSSDDDDDDDGDSKPTFLQICTTVYQAKREELTKIITDNLPSKLTLEGNLLPDQVESLHYVLRSCNKSCQLEVEFNKHDYVGDSFVQFFRGLTTTLENPHLSIKKLHLSGNKFGDDGAKLLASCLNKVEELDIRYCDISSSGIVSLSNELSKLPAPINKLDLSCNKFGDDGAKLLVSCLNKVEELDIGCCDISSSGIVSLSNELSKLPAPIKKLYLSWNRIGDDGAKLLASCLNKVEELDIGCCDISSSGIVSLSNELSKLPAPIKKLDLGCNNFGDDGAKLLASCLNKVEELDIGCCGISSSGIVSLSNELSKLPAPIKKLHLSGNKFGDDGAKLLASCLNKVEELDIGFCGISSSGIVSLSNELSKLPAPIKKLHLIGNKFGNDGAKLLASCLNKVEELDIRFCDISSSGIVSLSNELSKLPAPIKKLDLSLNKFGDDGAKALASCLNKVEELDIGACDISSSGIVSLSNELSKLPAPIKKLDLSENKFGDDGAKRLASCLNKVEELDISACAISSFGIVRLSNKLSKLPAPIKKLDLSCNGFGDDGAKLLASCLNKVEELDIRGCAISSFGIVRLSNKLSKLPAPRPKVVGLEEVEQKR